MIKALEKAVFAAQTDTRRRKMEPAIRKIESELVKNILSQSLALQIIRNSRKPTNELIDELISIEARVGEFVGQALREAGSEYGQKIDLRGALTGALSFIPFSPVAKTKLTLTSIRKSAITFLVCALDEKPAQSQLPERSSSQSLQTTDNLLPAPKKEVAGTTNSKSERTRKKRKKISSKLKKRPSRK